MFSRLKSFIEETFHGVGFLALFLSFLLGLGCSQWMAGPEKKAKDLNTESPSAVSKKAKEIEDKQNRSSSKKEMKESASNGGQKEHKKAQRESKVAKKSTPNKSKKKPKKKDTSKGDSKKDSKKTKKNDQYSKSRTGSKKFRRKNTAKDKASLPLEPAENRIAGRGSLPRNPQSLGGALPEDNALDPGDEEVISSSARRPSKLGPSETEKIVSEFSSHIETLPIGSQITNEERNALTAKLLTSQKPEDALINHRLGYRTIFNSESVQRDLAQEDETLSYEAWHFANWAAGFEDAFPEGLLDPSSQEEDIFTDRASRVSRFYIQEDFMGPLFDEASKSLEFNDKVTEKDEPGPFIHQHRSIFNELRFQYADLDSFEVTEVVMDQENPTTAYSEFQRCYELLLDEDSSYNEAKEKALQWIRGEIEEDQNHACALQA